MSGSVFAQSKKNASVLRHVVLFKFTDTTQPADVKKIEDAFRALSGKISLIKDFEWGTNSSPENLNQGLTVIKTEMPIWCIQITRPSLKF